MRLRSFKVAKETETTVISLDQDKIKRHEVTPSGLEIHLNDWGDKITADLHLTNYGEGGIPLKEWEDMESAQREYPALVKQFQDGNYILHLYSNGKYEVKFTSE